MRCERLRDAEVTAIRADEASVSRPMVSYETLTKRSATHTLCSQFTGCSNHKRRNAHGCSQTLCRDVVSGHLGGSARVAWRVQGRLSARAHARLVAFTAQVVIP